MAQHRVKLLSLLFVPAVPLLAFATIVLKPTADTPTPNGSYDVTIDGVQTTVGLACTQTVCQFDGLGVSLALSRTDDFREITSRWTPPFTIIAGGKIEISGSFHAANDPEYKNITQYWIPSSIGTRNHSIILNNFRAALERKGGRLDAPSPPASTHDGYVMLVWRNPLMSLSLSWDAIDPSENCFISVSGCANTEFGRFPIATPAVTTTTASSATSTTSTRPATTTTVVDASTTTTEATGGGSSPDTSNSIPDVTSTLATPDDTTPPVDAPQQDAEDSFITPFREDPVTPADAAATMIATVAGLSTVVAAGAAASSIAVVAGSGLGGGSSGLGGGSSGLGGSNSGSSSGSSSGSPPSRQSSASQSRVDNESTRPTDNTPTTSPETAGALFTTEYLDHAEQQEAAEIAKPPFVTDSRILARMFYDTGIVNAYCMLLSPSINNDSRRGPREPHVLRLSFLLSLLFPLSAAVLASNPVSSSADFGLSIALVLGFVCGWLSALHGLVFAVATLVLAALGFSELIADGQAAGINPILGIVLLVAGCCFTPILASTLYQLGWSRERSPKDVAQPAVGFVVTTAISWKICYELFGQTDAPPSLFGAQLLVPAVVGGATPVIRFMFELFVLKMSSPRAQLAQAFLKQTSQLRRGEIPKVLPLWRRISGIITCAAIVAFIAFAATANSVLSVAICIPFLGVMLLHTPLKSESNSPLLHTRIFPRLRPLPPIPNALKLLIPTLVSATLGVVFVNTGLSQTAAMGISIGFAVSMFLFEFYDVKSSRAS